jgi:hypothetical protein
VGIERRGLDRLRRRLLLRIGRSCGRYGPKSQSDKKWQREGVSILGPVIIDFLHLDAFDSLGMCRVALRPAGSDRSLAECISFIAF